MDEELMNLSTEETFEVDTVEVVESQVEVEDLEQNIETEETLDIVEVETVEEIDIVVDEAIGWVGGDSTRHYSLYGRDEYDQHPITAITGLRAELDNIEKLQTVYSDKRSQANYYKWKDENVLQENRVGYFVSIHEDINKIQICTGDNVFGVTVDAAGFIGGQSEIPRDITYGLVVCDGIAAVRCELGVSVDDYVIPNNHGMAQKVDNGYGYKVVALQDIGGVKHAVINLQIEINKIRNLVDNVDNLDERVGEAESNIVSAINMANAAYNKAGEAEYISEKALKDALESLKKSEETSDIIKDLENNISQNNTITIEARAIAESAAVSAESIRREAESTANNALSETSKLRKELEAIASDIDVDLDNTILGLEAAKEDIKTLENDLEPLIVWPEGYSGDDVEGVAGFVARADKDSVVLGGLVKWQGETNESFASFKQEVKDDYATQDMVSVVGNNLAEFKQEVKDDYATQLMVTNVENSLTTFKQEVENDYAKQEAVTRVDNALTNYKQEASNTYATQDSLTNLKTDTTNAIAASEEKATQTYASKNDLTSFESNTNIVMARIEQKADDNGASITSIVSSVDKYSVGEYSQAYGLTREQAASILKPGYIYIPTNNYDKCCDAHENGPSHCEIFLDDGEVNEFTPGDYYVWGINDQGNADWIEHSIGSVWIGNVTPSNSNGLLKYWYINSNEAPDGYEPHALYAWNDSEWLKVNVLEGNASNRITSMIRQTTNEISAEVVNARGGYAGLNARLSNTDAKVNSIASWPTDGNTTHNMAILEQKSDDSGSYMVLATVTGVGDEAEVTELGGAKIVLNDDDKGSFIQLDADHINFEGFTTFLTADDLGVNGTTTIDGARITTGSIQSQNYDSENADTPGMKLNLSDGTWDSKYFKIDADGNMIATGGTIGDWTIEDDRLSYGDNNECFIRPSSNEVDVVLKVGDKFSVYGDGKLYASGGQIGDCKIENNTLKIKSGNITDLSSLTSTIVNAATANIDRIVASEISTATFSATQITSGILSANRIDVDSIYIDGEQITSGTIAAARVGGIQADGSLGTSGWKAGSTYLYVEWAGKRTCLSESGISRGDTPYMANSTFAAYDDIIDVVNNGGSDSRIKNSIEIMPNIYEAFFDKLSPTRYKYNKGTSGRFHTGFIAQEVVSALAEVGLTTQDFAAVMLKNPNTESECWYLRRDEFVALNTWQIQKAKTRITELEAQVASLTDRLEALEKGE